MQTEFWEQVGKPVGLQRGLEGSTAKHTTAKQYSAALAKNPSLLPPLRPEITFSDRISGRAKGLEEGHTEAVKEFAQLVTQARAQVQRLKREVDALTNENGHLRKKLRDQAERFAKQVEDFGIQLKQAAARYTHLLTATVLQKMQLKARDRNLGKKHLPISAADF
jgi:regulator of replication initiation timing